MLGISHKFILGAALFLALLLPLKTPQAENWIEMFQGAYMNSDYVFVDQATGLVVVEVFLETSQGKDIDLMGVDCDRWYVYILSLNPGQGDRLIYPDWRTDPSGQTQISEGSPFEALAETVCPNRSYMQVADILN